MLGSGAGRPAKRAPVGRANGRNGRDGHSQNASINQGVQVRRGFHQPFPGPMRGRLRSSRAVECGKEVRRCRGGHVVQWVGKKKLLAPLIVFLLQEYHAIGTS